MATSNSVTGQTGISWVFEQTHTVGQYINGDWWVLGPVKVIGTNPGYMQSGSIHLNGSELNPYSARYQGFDSRGHQAGALEYNHALNVGPTIQSGGLTIYGTAKGESLVSTVSQPIVYPNSEPRLQYADVLTVVTTVPEATEFRPPYCRDQSKTYTYYLDSLVADNVREGLANIGTAPSTSSIIDKIKYVHLNHMHQWNAWNCMPTMNMPDYGRERNDMLGKLWMLYHTDILSDGDTNLYNLKVRMAQYAIDLVGIYENGGKSKWFPDGGINCAIKPAIIFGAHLLGEDDAIMAIGSAKSFQEDGQYFYIDSNTVLTGKNYTSAMVTNPPTAEWGIRHSFNPALDNALWTIPGNDYRFISASMYGTHLGMAIHDDHNNGNWELGAKKQPFHDYMLRHPVFGAASSGPAHTISYDPWLKGLWDAYIGNY